MWWAGPKGASGVIGGGGSIAVFTIRRITTATCTFLIQYYGKKSKKKSESPFQYQRRNALRHCTTFSGFNINTGLDLRLVSEAGEARACLGSDYEGGWHADEDDDCDLGQVHACRAN